MISSLVGFWQYVFDSMFLIVCNFYSTFCGLLYLVLEETNTFIKHSFFRMMIFLSLYPSETTYLDHCLSCDSNVFHLCKFICLEFLKERIYKKRSLLACPKLTSTFEYLWIFYFTVPPKSLVIYDEKRRDIATLLQPYNEGSDVNLICEADGGKPNI